MERSKQVFLTTAKSFYLEYHYIHLPRFVITILLYFIFISPSYSQEGMVYEKTIQVGEIEREYLLYVPSTYSGQEEWPLVLNFHGFSSNAAHQMTVSQMNAVADTGHFLVAYPQGLIVQNPVVSGPGPGWHLPDVEAEQDDVAFVDQLINQIESDYNISLSRIHATGWSMGSNMAFYMACALTDRIASVSGVGGPIQTSLIESCILVRPFSVLSIHGTADQVVPYEGVPDFISSAEVASEFWATQNSCDQEPTITELPDKDTEDGSTVTRFDYPNCDEDAEVVLYRINEGGHTWPGGGPLPEFLGNINRDINASAIIWDFFERHPYPDPFVHTLTLVNAKSNEGIQELKDGDLLDLSELPKSHLNVRAEVYGGVRSVKFELNNEEISIENIEPYAMFGDNKGDYRSGKLKPGDYVLKVTPYTAPNARGDAGESLEINIKVVRRNTMADVVKRTSDFSALLKALRRSGLLSKLVGKGPYTVFAPQDEAFARLLDDLGVKNIYQIPIKELQQILKYHVIGGNKLLASDLSDGMALATLLNEEVTISQKTDKIYVNDIEITKTDIQASNGVVHVVEEVLIPPEEIYNIVDLLSRESEYSILVNALEFTGLSSQLKEGGSLTFFAPDNVAFLKAFKILGINDIEQIPDFLLRKVLMYHLVHGKILTADIYDGQEESSLLGLPLSFSRNQDYIFVNSAYVIKADQEVINGVVHTISDLILPDINALLFGLEALLNNQEESSSLASRYTPALKVLASPNPGARGITIITHGMRGKKLTVTIMNYSGLQTKKIVYDLSQKVEETTLDFTSYSKGMYIIHAQVGHLQRDIKVMR